MAGDTIITIIGSLIAGPEMHFTPSGATVASFTVASTPRTFDHQTGEWKDGEALFMRCSIWHDAVENVTGPLTEGAHVIVQSRLVQHSCTTRRGGDHMVVEIQVDEIGPSLRCARAQITHQPRDGGQGGFSGGQDSPQGGGFDDNQGGQGGYNQGGPQQGGYNGGGGFGGRGQSRYNTPAGGAASGPWATGGPTSFDDEPPF